MKTQQRNGQLPTTDSDDQQYSWIVPHEFCWISSLNTTDPNAEVFIPAQIVSLNKPSRIATCSLEIGGDNQEIPVERLLIRNETEETFDDMVNMDLLNEAELLQNLRRRYNENRIYTYVGPTLLAVNPFKLVEGLYESENLQKYIPIVMNKADRNMSKKLPPHVYGLTAESFKDMFVNDKNQAMVISGESGAGKTENTKYCMKFLTSLGQATGGGNAITNTDNTKDSTSGNNSQNGQPSIEDKILSCNPILEAFGNAKTVRNDNSSRFGKYVTIIVEKQKKSIIGAQIVNYLLEKARITNQSFGERNFHIFYHFLKGESPEKLKSYGLEYPVNFEKYNYLASSKCFTVQKIDDVKLFQEVKDSFQILGFQDIAESIFNFLAAILLIGNIKFTEETLTNENPCSVTNIEVINQISKLLQVDTKSLIDGLTLKLRVISKQNYLSPLRLIECENTRDSLAKFIYEKMFGLIVTRLNEIIIPDTTYSNNSVPTCNIGLLDIYGFEVFKENGFEQFFINYTNEKLQQLYIQYVFKQEEQVFVKEGLENYLQYLSFTDNKPVIDLLDMPPSGIFNILDDVCQTKGSSEVFLNKLRNTHKANKYFITPKITAKQTFIIVHSAKDVEYTVTSFTEKNQDEMQELLLQAMQQSKNPLMQSMGQVNVVENNSGSSQGNRKKDKSLGSKFRNELQFLMNDLMSCDCHFIRCIKPNEDKRSDYFNPVNSLQQVRYLGVLESIKVRKQSYPIRKSFALFYKRYGIINQDFTPYVDLCKNNADFTGLSKKLFQKVFKGLDQGGSVLFGKTRVFMQNSALNDIEQIYDVEFQRLNKSAQRFQKAFYTYKQLKILRRNLALIRFCQQLVKVRIMYRKFKDMVKKTHKIQRWYRVLLQKAIIRKYRQSALVIQNYVQNALSLARYRRMMAAIIEVQRAVRRFLAKTREMTQEYCRDKIANDVMSFAWNFIMNRAAILIQKITRGFLARLQLSELVIQIKLVGQMMKEKKSATMIQKDYKMHVFRSKFVKQKRAAMKIQAFFKMKVLSQFYHELKASTLKIQKAMRMFLIRKHIRLERLQSYVDGCQFENIANNEQKVVQVNGTDGINDMEKDQQQQSISEMDVREMYFFQKQQQLLPKKKKNKNKKTNNNNTKNGQIKNEKQAKSPNQIGSTDKQLQQGSKLRSSTEDKNQQLTQETQEITQSPKKHNSLKPSFESVKSREFIEHIIEEEDKPIQGMSPLRKIYSSSSKNNQGQENGRDQVSRKEGENIARQENDKRMRLSKVVENNTSSPYSPGEQIHTAEVIGTVTEVDSKVTPFENEKTTTAATKRASVILDGLNFDKKVPQNSSNTQQPSSKSKVNTSNNSPANYYYSPFSSPQKLKTAMKQPSSTKSKLTPETSLKSPGPITASAKRNAGQIKSGKQIFPGDAEPSSQSSSASSKDTDSKFILTNANKLTLQPSKIYMFSHIIDFEMLADTQDIYPPEGWTKYYQEVFSNGFSRKDYVQAVHIGETHSLAVLNSSAMYSWGWNDFGQLGNPQEYQAAYDQAALEASGQVKNVYPVQLNRSSKSSSSSSGTQENSIDQVTIGNDYSLVLFKDGSLFGWGNNKKGQLGFYDSTGSTKIDIPTELLSLKHQESGISSVKTKGDKVYILLADGAVYINQKYSPYVRLPFSQKVTRVSCGHNFSMLLTTSAQIYGMGWNQHGQLGLGDTVNRKEPTLIPTFKAHQIAQVECGFAHVVCLSSYGRVYVWGWGERGQLGLGEELQDELTPQCCLLNNLYKDKVVQVVATRTSTMLLLDNSDILWFGTTQTIKYRNTPIIFKPAAKYKQLEGAFCMRLSSSWSKTVSIVQGTFAFSKDLPESTIASTCNILTKKWIQSNIDSLKPPIVESIYHKFPQQSMDVSANYSNNVRISTDNNNNNNNSIGYLQKEDSMKLSAIPQEISLNSDNLVTKDSSSSSFTDSITAVKLKEIKNKIEFLKSIPAKQLKLLDKQLIQLYQQKNFEAILADKRFFS